MGIELDGGWLGLAGEGESITLLELEQKGIVHDIARASDHIKVTKNDAPDLVNISWID